MKYDPNGIELWQQGFADGMNTICRSLKIDGNGNVCLAGTGGTAHPHQLAEEWVIDYATVKYDPDGDELWVHRYDYGGNDYAAFVSVDDANYVYVSGTTIGSDGQGDFATLKVSQDSVPPIDDAEDEDGGGGSFDFVALIALYVLWTIRCYRIQSGC